MISSNSWHLLLGGEVLNLLGTDMFRGLNAAEAEKRKHKVRGRVWHVRKTSASEAAVASLFDLPTVLLATAAGAAALFDKRFEAGAIVAVLVLGALIRTAVYIRANRILEDMARARIPVSSVIRDGRILLLPASEIVPGDIIFLEAGDTVPCDGRVITGDDSVVSERGITGNDRPVHKFNTVISTEAESGEIPCEFRSNMLFAGSLVLSGSVRIAATACGEDTLVSMKQGGITVDAQNDFPMVARLKKQSRTVSLVMLAAVLALSALSLFTGDGMSLPDVFLGAMAMAVASMSEFFSTIAAIILAVAVRRARQGVGPAEEGEEEKEGSRTRVLFRDPSRIEDVAAPDALVFCGSNFFKSGRAEILAYRVRGAYTGADEKGEDPSELIGLALAASTVAGGRTGLAPGDSPSKKLPRLAARRASLAAQAADAYLRRTGRRPDTAYAVGDHRDSSDRLAAGMEISLCERDGNVWAVGCGSVEEVLRCCSSVERREGTADLDPREAGRIREETAELEASGARVLAVAKRISPYPHLNRLAVLTQAMTFVGFFAVSVEPERGARENAEILKKSGIRPILFTENPREDLSYGVRLGLFDPDAPVIPASEWDAVRAREILGDPDPTKGAVVAFDTIGDAYLGSAFARAMISLVGGGRQTDGEDGEEEPPVIAAVGMEAWDAGALGRADLGFAVARSRFHAVPESIARGAAVVIQPAEGGAETDAGFGAGGLEGVTEAVRSARCAVTNVARARFYLTAAQTARLAVMLASVLGFLPLLSAVLILVWGLLFDFGAVLVRAFGQDDEKPALKIGREERAKGDRSTVTAVGMGLVWGVSLAAVSALLLRSLDAGTLIPSFAGTDAANRAFLSGAVLLSGAVFSLECGGRKSLFTRRGFNPVEILFVAASLVLAGWILFSSGGAAVFGGSPCGPAGFLAFLPALAVLAALETLKMIEGRMRSD